jgi:hypothetical protein
MRAFARLVECVTQVKYLMLWANQLFKTLPEVGGVLTMENNFQRGKSHGALPKGM